MKCKNPPSPRNPNWRRSLEPPATRAPSEHQNVQLGLLVWGSRGLPFTLSRTHVGQDQRPHYRAWAFVKFLNKQPWGVCRRLRFLFFFLFFSSGFNNRFYGRFNTVGCQLCQCLTPVPCDVHLVKWPSDGESTPPSSQQNRSFLHTRSRGSSPRTKRGPYPAWTQKQLSATKQHSSLVIEKML